jgi:hypothetical protein
VLGLWLLVLGAAVAAPLMQGPSDLCRSRDAAPMSQSESGMQCAACLPLIAPPPAELLPPPALRLPQSLVQRPLAGEIPASHLGAALARGPPASF